MYGSLPLEVLLQAVVSLLPCTYTQLRLVLEDSNIMYGSLPLEVLLQAVVSLLPCTYTQLRLVLDDSYIMYGPLPLEILYSAESIKLVGETEQSPNF